jgi:predicted Abi (CAAX) family protease
VSAITLILGLLIITGILFLIFRHRQLSQLLLMLGVGGKRWEFEPADEPVEPMTADLLQQIESDRTAASQVYQPIGLWTGRLILPAKEQRRLEDSVLFEVHNAPPACEKLVGKIVWLRWRNDPKVRDFVDTVTRDVNFTQKAINSQKAGNVHPVRLNNWPRVGPLESLAGTRPQDDMIVMLKDAKVVRDESIGWLALESGAEPVQISGRICALVTILRPEVKGSDSFLVRHYNKRSGQFDGPFEMIRIPQVPPDRQGVSRTTNHLIEKSPFNADGWYIYGERDGDGVFVTKAIEPRAIMRVGAGAFSMPAIPAHTEKPAPAPDEVRLGLPACKRYLLWDNWINTRVKKGTAKTVLLAPAEKSEKEAIWRWQEGDTAIVMHVFGGIGGKKGDPIKFGIVTGHFAYGVAYVVRDSFTGELRFDIEYRQVYAHNPDGIVAGTIKWFNYMGDLQRGWLGNRPVCDFIVKFDAITKDYNFDGIKLSAMEEFCQQLDVMTARYRIGDGTGASVVTPVTSCVQDSNQALYVTIQQMQQNRESNPRLQKWLQTHPDDAQTVRFWQLVELAHSLEINLVPLGIVVPDWREKVDKLAGINNNGEDNFLSEFIKILTTWRTMIPRRAHDEIAGILLRHNAALWAIRTNQVGGFDRDIEPLAPTTVLGYVTR